MEKSCLLKVTLLMLIMNCVVTGAYADETIISFADPNVKAICVANWDTNGDGELSKDEAAEVTDLNTKFKGNTDISSFDELQYFTGLTSIYGGSGQTIGAFVGCNNLTSIIVPNTVNSIGNNAFQGCAKLSSLIIPASVTSIGSNAFYGCSALTSIKIPEGITNINTRTFYGCSSLTSITIPEGLISIGGSAFEGCGSLTSVNIPEGLVSIGGKAFSGCNNLNAVNINDLSAWCKISFGDFYANPLLYAKRLYVGGKEVFHLVIPSDIIEIKPYAFYGCSSFGSISFSDNVTIIGNNAFSSCSNLGSITIPNNVISIGTEAFQGCQNLTSAIVSGDMGARVFSNCPNLTSVTISKNVKTIGAGAFEKCTSLTNVEIQSDHLTKIGDYCFWKCSSLKSLAIPEGINTIGYLLFEDCASLESVDIPRSVTSIYCNAFTGCSNLNRINIVDISSWCNIIYTTYSDMGFPLQVAKHLFLNGKELSHLVIPNDITTIDRGDFGGCLSIQSLIVPESVEVIYDNAFNGCTNLESVTVKATTPPLLYDNSFSKWDCTLYVPAGTKSVYEAADGWKNFTEIVELEAQKFTLEISGNFNSSESHLYDRDGKEYDVSDFAYNEFDEGSYIRIEPFVYPGSYYIREILVNGESVGVWTDENTAPTEYVIESLSCNTTVEFRTYYNERLRTLSCKAEGPGNIKMYKNDILVGTTPDQGNPRYCSAVFNEGDVLKLEFIPDAGCALTQFLGSFMGDGDLDMFNLSGDVIDNTYTISFPYNYNDDYPLLRCFAATFEKETQDYSLTVDPGNYCTVEHLYVKKGDEVIETIDGGNSCSVEEGCSVGIELSVPAGLYIREIIVNDVTVATYTDEDVANGNNPDGYLLENISENTIVKFKTYPRVEYRCFGCTASGPGKVEMYRNGNYVGTTTSQDGGYPYLTCEALDEGEVLKFVFVSDKGGTFTKLMAGEHDGYEDTDFTGKVVDNTLTITMDFGNEDVLQYRSFIAYFEGPEPSTNNTLSASVPTILTGKTAPLSLSLANEDDIIMTEFYIQLPEGITIEEDEDGYPKVTLNSERSNNHSLEVSRNSEGLYHFLVFSSRNYALKGHEGELFSMNLVCAEGVAAGTYQATVKNILLSDPNKNEITPSDFTFDVTVMDVAMGDANGDGRINGMDIVEMVDYIMERPSDTFVFAAADLTADQKVNGMDLVELVSLVMAQGAASPQLLTKGKGAQMPHHFDSGLTLTSHDDGSLTLGVEKSDAFILAQMIVEVDGGRLTDVTTDTKHEVAWRQIGENRYAVLAYSTKNCPFAANDELLKLYFANDANSIRVTDVMLASAEREERRFESVACGSATGINSIGDSEWANGGSVYDLQGRKVMSTLPRKGIYIMNGKKVVRK